MGTLGQQLKAAREEKGVSESEAGSATNILAKLIVAMEADDFSTMPAPTYAKGFIRLYAAYLGLDPVPLVKEYLENNTQGPRPLLDDYSQFGQKPHRNSKRSTRKAKEPKHPHRRAQTEEKGEALSQSIDSLKAGAGNLLNSLPGRRWKDIRVLAGAAAAVIVLATLISMLSTCIHRRAEKTPSQPPTGQTDSVRRLIDGPVQDVYLTAPGTLETN